MKTSMKQGSLNELFLRGIGVSSGVAIGPAFVIDQHGIPVPEYEVKETDIENEIKRFHVGIAKTQKQLGQIRKKADSMEAGVQEDIGLLLDAYKGMVSSSRLLRGVEKAIVDLHMNAEAAVQKEIAALSDSFARMNDDYLASRASDVREVGMRLIRNLLREQYNPFADAPENSILVAEEITPADTALMDPDRVGGLMAVLGGAEGHAAIMARALALPAVLGVTALISHIQNGDTVILDGAVGDVIIRPTTETLKKYRQKAAGLARENKKLEALRDEPSVTRDGTAVRLEANLEFLRDAAAAVEAGAEGVGLLRTEFSFMNRPQLPSEEEQFQDLVAIVKKMKGSPVTVRTLDVGGEKLAMAFSNSLGVSSNPALGLRAIRLGLKEKKLLETQLAAILRASAYGPVRILIPMISSIEQMRQVRRHLVAVEKKLQKRGIKLPPSLPPLGAMIEIPGAALAADALTRVCDFFAIGSNDLTQYTLAIDRGDEQVAELYDPYHPAVLRLIQFVIAAAWRANIPVSACGELAGNPRATALLLGLGLRQFSMSPARLLKVKQEVRRLQINDCVEFAGKILSQSDEVEIAALLDKGA